jgi:hypothetical protein
MLEIQGASLFGDSLEHATHASSFSLVQLPSTPYRAVSSITVSPECSAILYEADDFSGAETAIGAGEHTFGSSNGPGAVRLVPRASVASSWEAALESQHGVGAASLYTHETCRVYCADEAVDDYLAVLHKVRELSMLRRNDRAGVLLGELCQNGSTSLSPLLASLGFFAVHDEACTATAMLQQWLQRRWWV